MNVFEMKGIVYDKPIEFYLYGKVREICQAVNLKLETGNVYCIDCGLSTGGWAISWAFTGQINLPEDRELDFWSAYLDDLDISHDELKELGCSVGLTGFERTFSANKPVGKLLDRLIKKSSRGKSINDLQKLFMLNEERFNRGIRHCSNERWRLTIAMGYARGSRIFGFPWMRSEFISRYKELWMKQVFKSLLKEDCVVIIPTEYNDNMSDLFTKVIKFEKPHGTIRGEPIDIIDLPYSYE